MSLMGIFDIAASGMTAQSTRLNTIASNLSNADSVAGDPALVYRPRQPVFSAIQQGEIDSFSNNEENIGVTVDEIIESNAQPQKEYRPGHPMADNKGYIYLPNVKIVEEMANMISASRSYQTNAEVFNTAKQMMLQTLNIGR